MPDKITYRITKQPTLEPIVLDCPNCHSPIQRRIPIGLQGDYDHCPMCSCEFVWVRAKITGGE